MSGEWRTEQLLDTISDDIDVKLFGSEPNDPIHKPDIKENSSSPELESRGFERKTSDKSKARVVSAKKYIYPSKKQY